MSRGGHYGFERRRRADIQKAKQEAKRQRKNERAESGAPAGPELGEAQDTGAPTGMWEWFSPSRGRTVTSAPRTRPAPDPPDDWVLLTDVEPDAKPES